MYNSVCIVGPIYSGKSTVRRVFEKELGYTGISHSDILIKYLQQKDWPFERDCFAKMDKEICEEHGRDGLAKLLLSQLGSSQHISMDGVRRSDEIVYYKKMLDNLLVIAVDADYNTNISRGIRYRRMKTDTKYEDSKDWNDFCERDFHEWQSEQYDIGNAMQLADDELIGHRTKENLEEATRILIARHEFSRAVHA